VPGPLKRRAAAVGIALAAAALWSSAARAQFIAPLDASEPIGYFIAPVPQGFAAGDRELATWALRAWDRAAGKAVSLRPAPEAQARIRVYWVEGNGSYGEMRPIRVNGRRGAAVFVRPVDAALGAEIARRVNSDPLFRETIMYLTCLHEVGHALGLTHTRDFRDIMYSFRFGGDIEAYFERYRARLRRRADIRRWPGMSAQDRQRLRDLYPRRERHRNRRPSAGSGPARR